MNNSKTSLPKDSSSILEPKWCCGTHFYWYNTNISKTHLFFFTLPFWGDCPPPSPQWLSMGTFSFSHFVETISNCLKVYDLAAYLSDVILMPRKSYNCYICLVKGMIFSTDLRCTTMKKLLLDIWIILDHGKGQK